MACIVSKDEASIDQVRNWLIKHVGRMSRADSMQGEGWHLNWSKNGLLLVYVTDPEHKENFKQWLAKIT